MKEMTIIMITDKNYIIPTKVAIYSMIRSSDKNCFFSIHILCDRNLDEERRNNLRLLERKYSDRVEITFDEVHDKLLDQAKTHAHIPVASYYRLYISDLLQEDRCLYIDGDVIVRSDLSHIYDLDLNHYYIAGVRDCSAQNRNPEFVQHEKELGIPSMNEYVNAGFMLYNLKKIREDGLEQKFIMAIRNGYTFMDQDILNKFCYGKIKQLSLKYNLFSEYYLRVHCMKKTQYSKEELEEATKNFVMLHYTGVYKPWLCTRLKANQLWWDQAKQVLSEDEFQAQLEKAKKFEKESDWSFILAKIKNQKQVIIFGFSEIGRGLVDRILNFDSTKIIIFVDNNKEKHGMKYKGVSVLSVNKAKEIFPDAFWIISSQNGYIQIAKQLKNAGINDNKIVRYYYKGIAYYEGLKEEYQTYEINMLEGK